MADILFGTGGVPHSASDRSVAAGVRRIKELKLDCMEVEFVHGVRIRKEAAEEVGRLAAEIKVALTCHGPYYINLNSEEKEKIEASVKRIIETARAGQVAWSQEHHFPCRFFHERG